MQQKVGSLVHNICHGIMSNVGQSLYLHDTSAANNQVTKNGVARWILESMLVKQTDVFKNHPMIVFSMGDLSIYKSFARANNWEC